MTTLAELREGIASYVQSFLGDDLEVHAFEGPIGEGPAFVVTLPTMTGPRAMVPSTPPAKASVVVRLLVSFAVTTDDLARQVSAYIDPAGDRSTSLYAVLAQAGGFDLDGVSSHLQLFQPTGMVEWFGSEYWGGEFVLDVVLP